MFLINYLIFIQDSQIYLWFNVILGRSNMARTCFQAIISSLSFIINVILLKV